MQSDLEKLRIDKSHKVRKQSGSGWGWTILLLLLVAGGIGFAFWQNASAAPVVQTMRVRMPEGAVSERDLVALNATGYIMAAHKIQLASKVIGRVAWVGVEMGDKVRKGQELVRLEDDEFRARVAQQQGQLDSAKARLRELEAGSRPEEIGEAKADLDMALAGLANAESNMKRLRDLHATRTISIQEFDDAETLVKSRQAQVDARRQRYEMVKSGPRIEQIAAQRATVQQLEGALSQVQIDLDNTIIRSPVDGTILQRNVEIGEFVTTGFVGDRGAKGYVVSLADLNDLRVELDISQNDFAKVRADQPCWIVTDAYPDRKYDGVVDLISPEANRQKATVLVRVKVVSPDERLKPDMNATVSFLSDKSAATQPAGERAVLRIPANSVRNGSVFVVEAGKAVGRVVSAGPSADGQIEIRKGLIGGEDLILNPPESLKDGDPVKLEGSPT